MTKVKKVDEQPAKLNTMFETDKTQTVANKIWEEIKNIPLDLFGIKGRPVNEVCSPVLIEPTKCYLTIKVGAVLPALEEAIGKKYEVNLVNKFVVVDYNKSIEENTYVPSVFVNVK